ncbi:hypothetical protein NDU88_001942 [Pleurodeles waltl]|uniref:Uncharacterized protein n=1 Tax=Pleurodeles waltl TaxID=8319 RepID=A0AAV7Q5A5_PLEWA|nr:hypothetical protein NDU88_001942 [Pleurodeles waltl]
MRGEAAGAVRGTGDIRSALRDPLKIKGERFIRSFPRTKWRALQLKKAVDGSCLGCETPGVSLPPLPPSLPLTGGERKECRTGDECERHRCRGGAGGLKYSEDCPAGGNKSR